MRTGELCVREVVTATRDELVRDIAARMTELHVGSVVVVDYEDEAPRPIGIVTDRDLVRTLSLEELGHTRALTVGDVMSRDLLTAIESEDVLTALARMRARGVRRLPIVDERGALVGMLAFDDIVEWLTEELTGLTRLVGRERRNEQLRSASSAISADPSHRTPTRSKA
jgi:CBS domain-containing protein